MGRGEEGWRAPTVDPSVFTAKHAAAYFPHLIGILYIHCRKRQCGSGEGGGSVPRYAAPDAASARTVSALQAVRMVVTRAQEDS